MSFRKSTKQNLKSPPTGDRRHVTGIRLGKISFEVFAKDPKRRRELEEEMKR